MLVALALLLVPMLAPAAEQVVPEDERAKFLAEQTTLACSNISLVIFDKTKEHPTGLDIGMPIIFGFVSTSSAPYNVLMLRPEYSYRLRATSELGAQVVPTKMGAIYGTRFDQVSGFNKIFLDHSGHHLDRQRPYWMVASTGLPPTRSIPPLKELLHLNAPGRYTVEIEIQCLSYPYRTAATNSYLVKFPPAKFQIVVPAGH